MHRHWKSSAFDIEGTRVTAPQRIARLLIPIALCYALCGLEGMREQAAGEVCNAHKEKRTTSLFLRGLTRFTHLLRAVDVSRVRQFFEQLFNGYRWLDTLHQPFHPKVLAHFFQNEPKSECKRGNRKVRTCEISRFLCPNVAIPKSVSY